MNMNPEAAGMQKNTLGDKKIPKQLEALATSLTHLEDAIAELDSRLAPISSSPLPCDPGQDNPKDDCAVAGVILQATDRVRFIGMRVRGILEVLEV